MKRAFGGIAIGLAAVSQLPLMYILVRALGADAAIWRRLWVAQLPSMLSTTLLLVAWTVVVALTLGVGLAWLVERTDLPGRAVWRWLLVLPLAIPGYVGAACWISLLGRGGYVDAAIRTIGAVYAPPDVYSIPFAGLVIGMLVFPNIYLPVAAVLRSMSRSLDDAARMAGLSAWQTARRITIPWLAPAAASGALLVALYVLSDFGTVGMLRLFTFTSAIYTQFSGSADRAGAAILSALLLGLTIPLLASESLLAKRGTHMRAASSWKPAVRVALGGRRWLAFVAVSVIALLSLGVPVMVFSAGVLGQWLRPTVADQLYGYGDTLAQWGFNSLLLAGISAAVATALSLAPAWLAARAPGRFARIIALACMSPFALPGLLIGLSFVFVFATPGINVLYGTVTAVMIAFVVRLVPQAVSSNVGALRVVPVSAENAARVMGLSEWHVLRRITLPVAAPGLLATWVLVFVTAMKELPTALLLRPPGFDTLAVRVWSAARDSVYSQAAAPALLMIVLTAIPLSLIYGRWARQR